MKLFRVVMDDYREEEIVADAYTVVDQKFIFFANGEPIPDIYFREDGVKGVHVLSHNYERDFRPRGGGS